MYSTLKVESVVHLVFKECLQHYGDKDGIRMTFKNCHTIDERAQMSLA